MKIKRSTFTSKFLSVIKWVIIKLYFSNKFNSSRSFFIGSNFKIFIENGKISMGLNTRIADQCEIQSRNSIINIGDNFNLNSYSRIISFENISIGDNVTIAQNVSILDHDHGYCVFNNKLTLEGYKTKQITIGNNVWIGDKVVITKGVTVGDNVIIGAGSIITKSIESNSVVAGNPFKVIKKI